MKKIIFFVVFLCIFSALLMFVQNLYVRNKLEKEIEKISDTIYDENYKNTEQNEEKIVFLDGSIGLIIIPSIGIKAPIYEGTGTEILKYSVRTF